jgi:hypothetical protein
MTATTHFKVGFKSGAGFPVMFNGQYPNLEAAQEFVQSQTRAGYGKHYVWKITVEEIQ